MLMRTPETPNIVIMGGGSGGSRAAKIADYMSDANLTVLVGMSDNGSSTGRLSRENNTLPVGDARRVLGAVAASDTITDLLEVRFGEEDTFDSVSTSMHSAIARDTDGYSLSRTKELLAAARIVAKNTVGGLKGHTFGNFLLTAAAKDMPFDVALHNVGAILGARAQVLPVTNEQHTLFMHDGGLNILEGEHVIDTHEIQHPFLDDKNGAFVYLSDKNGLNVPALPSALEAIRNSDLTIVSSGSPFTSIAPALLPQGITDALRVQGERGGKFMAFTNLENQPHDTLGWCVGRYALFLAMYAERMPDKIFMNNQSDTLANPENAVRYDEELVRKHQVPVVRDNLVGKLAVINPNDPIGSTRGAVFHDPRHMADLISTYRHAA